MEYPFKKFPVGSFLFLSFAISWGIWVPLALQHNGMLSKETTLPSFWMGVFGPAIAAVILTAIREGSWAVDGLVRRLFEFKKEAGWIAISILFPLAVWLSFNFLFGKVEMPTYYDGTHSNWIGIVLLAFFTWGFGGEPGWRGYFLTQLQKKNTPTQSAFMVFAAWALWHFPLFFFHQQFTWMGANEIGLWTVQTCSLSVILTWLFNRSSKSLLAACLCYSMLQIRPESSEYAVFIASITFLTAAGLWIASRIQGAVVFAPAADSNTPQTVEN